MELKTVTTQIFDPESGGVTKSVQIGHLWRSENKGFDWTEKHEDALEELKNYLTIPPLLAKPKQNEDLYVYLSVTDQAVSGVLVREDEGVQSPIYYVSKSLVDLETRYTSFDQLVLALTMTSIKLRHYFESHKIHIITNFPMRTVLRKPDLTGHMAKWAIRLSTYDISYDVRTAIKSQALADFVADFSPSQMTVAEEEFQHIISKADIQPWMLFTDGASNVNGIGLGLLLKSPQGDTILYSICCDFKATNNEVEYGALILGMTVAVDLKIKHVDVNYDSLLIVNHVNGLYEAKDPKIIAYLDIVKKLKHSFDTFNIRQVPRENNTQEDDLAGLGAVFKNVNETTVPIIHILKPAIERMKEQMESSIFNIQDNSIEKGASNWTVAYKEYLTHGNLPNDVNEARTLRMKSSSFTMIDDVLFKKSYTGLLQRCLEKDEAIVVMKDVHEGEYGNHTNGRSLSLKILRMGYYWPTLRHDALEYTKKCDACQRHAPTIHQPSEHLHPSIPSWPFMKWGMDFSKWIEVEAFRQVTSKEVISFIKRNILCKFGVPSEIICDNGSQFISDKTETFCKRRNISLIKSTPRYPQANGQAESSNKIIINNLKKRLTSCKGKWAEELPWVLWPDRTTPKTSTGQTPYSLVYGAEAVLPTEVMMPTARYELSTYETNVKELSHDVDTVDELREMARIQMASYQQKIAGNYK